ncbi:hypothetical protein EVJ32_10800 [Exiguobacterium sp. SH5S4]|uniref:hypothetical protein n=1 Tax=Exiguobacterium sp. SH5S4 TaxID=2510961 RepID=UPI001038C2E4|nr:hypothetical protein [Exiguobacterium sp. SH5S4]TCI25280.1 hypothetical protein EVJ32_10800 [Exiguobacterium sp. SH5S4]
MKTCMYCGTEVTVKETVAHCEFCQMDLAASEVMKNSERKKNVVKPIVDLSNIMKSTKELMLMSTYELLALLQLVRKDRSMAYDNMIQVKTLRQKAKDENNEVMVKSIEETLESVIEDYAFVTRKMWVIENILAERMDTVPARITDSYLERFFEKVQSRKSTPMLFGSSKATVNH